jgi:hypothetical protein
VIGRHLAGMLALGARTLRESIMFTVSRGALVGAARQGLMTGGVR